MLILGIESATPVASVALVDEKGLLGSALLNVGLTHSQQLLPLLDSLFVQCRREKEEVTLVAVSAGPGSFTGLRIGMATAKGLAQGWAVDLVTVSTLESMTWPLQGQPALVSPMLNARRHQVYTALYQWRPAAESDDYSVSGEEAVAGAFGGVAAPREKKERPVIGDAGMRWHLHGLLPPQAVSPEMWAQKLREACGDQRVFLLGDGANELEEIWQGCLGENMCMLPPILGVARAEYVALAAMRKRNEGKGEAFYGAVPLYLRGI